MSDPSIEEESLISQDDIDKLLDASSNEDVEDNLEAGGAGDDLDDMGELSQDDIDRLMNGSSDTEDEDEDEDDEDMELISQDDIDRLMNPSGEDAQDADDDDDDADDELISMDDIQGLINTESNDEELEGNDEDSETNDSDPSEPLSGSDSGENEVLDGVINEDEAIGVADCLLTQETMDELIKNAKDSDELSEESPEVVNDQDTVVLDDAAAPEPEVIEEDLVGDDSEELPLDLSADIDLGLETEDSDLFDSDLDAGDDGDVTQDDIDALLQESDDDDDLMSDDDDILISQDDIDTLLMASDQEDEDVLGDSLMDDLDDDDLDDLDSEDLLDDEEVEAFDTEANQVVLEGADPVQEGDDLPASSKERGKWRKIFKSKLVLAALSAMLVLGISVPAAYFMFSSKPEVPLPAKEVVPVASQEFEVPSIIVEEKAETMPVRQSGNIVLTDFIILASDQSSHMTYIYADISIDYSDQRAYHEISNNSPFYRDLIYDSIQTQLVTGKKNELTEADLIWGVETSLKKVLPPHYIEKISFKTFRTS